MCRVLEVSRSGFYAWLKRPPSQRQLDDKLLGERIEYYFQDSDSTYGTIRLKRELRNEGHQVSRARVGRLMSERGLVAKAERKRRKKVTTRPNPNFQAPENLVRQDFQADEPNQVWLSDITYVATLEGWIYVATVMDLFSRKIVGWSIQKTMRTELVMNALTMAVQKRRPEAGLIHHSDRGCQYASGLYQELLERNGMVCSMSGRGNCYDNAPMESFFGTLKVEIEIKRFERLSAEQAKTKIFRYIEVFYNRKRQHSSLGYLSPTQFETQLETQRSP